MLVNDVSALRNLIPGELAKGFGFLQSKPASAFSPVAVTPDELGAAWDARPRLHLPLEVGIERQALRPRRYAGTDMVFDFAHPDRPRWRRPGANSRPARSSASGTVSNKQGGLFGSSVDNGGVGYCCIAELRMYETIEQGTPKTPYMRFGDRVRIEMRDNNGASIFGAIEQGVERYAAG
jgi:fumarylacetoacetate (FAA) hydrolase